MVVGVRVESENIQTGVCTHCNSSYFTMVAKNTEGNSVPVPGIILEDKHNVRRYLRSIKRRIDSIRRENSFDEMDYKLEENYLEKLKNHNMKLADNFS